MLPVLMYHGLHPDADVGARRHFDPVYSVDPGRFAQQLDWLSREGYRSVTLEQALAGREDADARGKPVVISFDDGDVSNIEVALPLLRQRGMVAEFFITSDFIDQPGMLAAADVRALARAGMGIGSHGRSHAYLADLEAGALDAELRESRRRLREISGLEVASLALPGGRGGLRELSAARALGYRHLLGSVPGPNRRPQTGTWLQRIAVTRQMALIEFAALVQWQGLRPRLASTRFAGLALCKRMLGNGRYERLRARLL